MDEDGEAIRVPVRTRTHELSQLQHYVPRIEILLDGIGLEEEAEDMARIHEHYIEDVEPTYPEGPEFAAYISMPADDWRDVVHGLGRFETTHAGWLQKKLVRRLTDRLEEME